MILSLQLGQVLVEALAAKAAQAAGHNAPPSFTWDKALHAWTCSVIVPLRDQRTGQSDARMTFMKVGRQGYQQVLTSILTMEICVPTEQIPYESKWTLGRPTLQAKRRATSFSKQAIIRRS